MSAFKGRDRNAAWTLTAPEEIVLQAIQEADEGLSDKEIAEVTGMSENTANRVRGRLEKRGLVRSHSTKKTMRYVQGRCPGCGALVNVALGEHSGTKVWRPAGDALKRPVKPEEGGQVNP